MNIMNDDLKQSLLGKEEELGKLAQEHINNRNELNSVQKGKDDLEQLVQTLQLKSEEIRSEKDTLKSDSLTKENQIEELKRSLDERESEISRIQQVLESKE